MIGPLPSLIVELLGSQMLRLRAERLRLRAAAQRAWRPRVVYWGASNHDDVDAPSKVDVPALLADVRNWLDSRPRRLAA